MTVDPTEAGASAAAVESGSALAREITELQIQNAELARRLVEAESTAAEVYESRRAALNVLEDVVEAQRKTEELNRALQQEITERKQAQKAVRFNEKRTSLQKEAFQAAVDGAPLGKSLSILAGIVTDEVADEVRTNFYLVDGDGTCLHPVPGAGTMPDSYSRKIDGFKIGEDSLACGLAIPTRRPVLTRDVFDEPLWKPFLHLAREYDFRGCWSFPIKTREKKGLGTFALYFREPREATPEDVVLGELVTQAAGIIISHHTEAQERARVEQALRESEAKLARELADSRQLQRISSQLIEWENAEAIYDKIVDAAIALMRSQAASIQLLDPETEELRLLAWKGFHPDSAKHWERVSIKSGTSCGAALRYGERTVVPDVNRAEILQGSDSLAHYRLSGIVAIQSTPLISRGGRKVGMLSTHWSHPYEPSERDCALLDVLARQAADVFERMIAERALRESEQNLRGLANIVPDLLWTSEPDGSTSWCNERTLRYTGRSFKEITGWGWTTVIHPDDLERTIERYREAIEKAQTFEEEHRIRSATGEYRWFLVRSEPVRDAKGNLLRMYAAATDIHDLRTVAEAVSRSEDRLQRVLEIGTVGVIFFDFSGQILNANDAFLELIGASREELKSGLITYHTLTPPEWKRRDKQTFKELKQTGESAPAEKQYLCKNGSRIWVYCASKKLPDETAVEFVLDITKRKRAEEGLTARMREQVALYDFVRRRNEVDRVEELYDVSLDTIMNALRCDRASILLFDEKNVMRFVAWRGLSERYRKRADGHSPWKPNVKHPRAITVEDVAQADLEPGLKRAINREGIRALVHLPLLDDDTLLGKFVTYYDAPHDFTEEEIRLARTIADQLSHALNRMRTEIALREANERFRLLVEGARGYAIFMVNPSNVITHWNKGAERVFGWTAEEAIGKSGRLIFTAEDRRKKQEEKEIATALRHGQAADRRWHRRKDGSRIWVDGVMHRIDDSETGALRGFAKIARDATADRMAQEELERRVEERTAELRKANQILHEQMEERARLEQRILMVTEREKRRIGDDLHDSLCQELAATAFFLETQAKTREKGNARDARVFADAARLVNANVGLARDLARGLHPVDLRSGGLAQALKELAYRTSQRDVACRCDCPPDIRVPDQAVALNLYRIAAEAVGNATRHASARNIVISLNRARSGLILRVKDDGNGMENKPGHKGMGLEIMRHRASVIGAQLRIESGKGHGTTVTCTLPGE